MSAQGLTSPPFAALCRRLRAGRARVRSPPQAAMLLSLAELALDARKPRAEVQEAARGDASQELP